MNRIMFTKRARQSADFSVVSVWRSAFSSLLRSNVDDNTSDFADLESGASTPIDDTSYLSDLASGQSTPVNDARSTKSGPKEPDEETPLLGLDNSQRRQWHRRSLSVLYQILLAPVVAVLVFLPMLPFWTSAAFLVYMIMRMDADVFVYAGVLAVVLPFNVLGTVVLVRAVWRDLSGG